MRESESESAKAKAKARERPKAFNVLVGFYNKGVVFIIIQKWTNNIKYKKKVFLRGKRGQNTRKCLILLGKFACSVTCPSFLLDERGPLNPS